MFFSKAYKRLYSIYEFQNKTVKKDNETSEYYNNSNNTNNTNNKKNIDETEPNRLILDRMFNQNKSLKNSNNFNEWFNNQFENIN